MSNKSSSSSSSNSSGNSSFQTVNGGVSLFLLTFIILCLVSFAALSIVSARADARLTEKYRQQTEYYYGARNEAQKYLQELDGGAGGAAGIDAGIVAEAAVAGDGDGTGATVAESDGAITRRFPAGPHMDLVLTVQPSGTENISEAFGSSAAAGQDTSAASSTAGRGDKNYHVICEKTESTVTYNYDSTLPVMKR